MLLACYVAVGRWLRLRLRLLLVLLLRRLLLLLLPCIGQVVDLNRAAGL